ncbi:unnamed protein product [Sphagnum balticum]
MIRFGGGGGGSGKFGEDGKVVGEASGKLGEDDKDVSQGSGKMGVGEGGGQMGVGDGSGQMGVDGEYVGGKDGGLLVAAVLVNAGQQEEVKGDAKGGSKHAHLTDLDKNDELAGMLSSPNKGLSEYGGGDATRMVVEGGEAPCKTATMVEEVGKVK